MNISKSDVSSYFNSLLESADKDILASGGDVYLIKPNLFKPDVVYKVVNKDNRIYFCRVGGQFYDLDPEIALNDHLTEEELLAHKLSFSVDKKTCESAAIELKKSSWTGFLDNNGTLKLGREGKLEKYIIHPVNNYKRVAEFFENALKRPVLLLFQNKEFANNMYTLKAELSLTGRRVEFFNDRFIQYKLFNDEKVYCLSDYQYFVFSQKKKLFKFCFDGQRPLIINAAAPGIFLIIETLRNNRLFLGTEEIEGLFSKKLSAAYYTLVYFLQHAGAKGIFEYCWYKYDESRGFECKIKIHGRTICGYLLNENKLNFCLALNGNDRKRFDKLKSGLSSEIQVAYDSAEIRENVKYVAVELTGETHIYDITRIISSLASR